MEIRPDCTAVVLVDLQVDVLATVERSVPEGADVVTALLDRTQLLLGFARELALPVMWVKVERRSDLLDQADLVNGQVRAGAAKSPREARVLIQGTEGAGFAPPLAPEPKDDVVVKRRVSGFHGTALDTLLRARGIGTLLLSGVNTEVGVESTARAAWDHDYKCVGIATAAPRPRPPATSTRWRAPCRGSRRCARSTTWLRRTDVVRRGQAVQRPG